MGLAPFFDKAALAAASVLQGFDRERFATMLEAETVAIAFDDAAAHSTEGRTTLTLAVNLAARMYPTLALIARGTQAEALRSELAAVACAVNPNIALTAAATLTADAVVLVVGESDAATFGFDIRAAAVYIGSHGWEARVSTSCPIGSGVSMLPFGAAAAACLGAANVFRQVFRAQLPNAGLDAALTLSTLSLATQLGADALGVAPVDTNAPITLTNVDLGETVLVGAGAVGQGLLWALARLPGLQGTLHVVDGEAVDASNPQRYVLAAAADEGTKKVALAAELMSADQDSVRTCAMAATGDLPPSVALTGTAAGAVLRKVAPTERAAFTIVPHAVR